MTSLKRFQWAFILVGLVLGLMLALQFRVTRDIQQTDVIRRAQDLTGQVAQLKRERDALQTQVTELRSRMEQMSAGPQGAQLKQEMDHAGVLAGVTELTGSGVEVTLNDSSVSLKPGENPNLYVLHDEDVLRVLNELKAAGAEAMAMNGERLLATTEIRCIGPTIVLNKNKRLAPPYVVTAIGNPDTMENSLKMKGGVAETLQFWGIQVSVKKMPQVMVPPYTGGIRYDYATAAGS
jgi:uncharacterized protein YlxW (UPF0749 family)